MLPHFDVVVGVILGENDTVLIAKRPSGKIMAGYWEFPGGKLEPGESEADALKRELNEELGIHCETFSKLMTVEQDYPDQNRHVRLAVYTIESYFGSLQGMEGQELKWCPRQELNNYDYPSANHPIIQKLTGIS